MKRVLISAQAARDIERLEAWLTERGALRAATRLGSLLADSISSLQQSPERRTTGSRADLRELVVPFGSGAYLIHYRIEPEQVIIARIRHSREQRAPSA